MPTDNAQIRTSLLEVLQNIFTVDKMSGVFKEQTEVCLYGEGYGKGIHKGGNYLPNSVNFILFDIKIGEWWLTRESIQEIAEMLGISKKAVEKRMYNALDSLRKISKSIP